MKIVADENIPFIKECISHLGEVITVSGREITNKILTDADALLVRSITKVNQNLLEDTSVQFVATATIGTDHIDLDYLKNNNIAFASAPGSNANSVAEYIISALLTLADKEGYDLTTKSIGIIGVGNVGSKVEAKAHALGMQVYLNDPPLSRLTGHSKYLPIQKLYECDIITIHTPLTHEGVDKTYHLADEQFFDSLKPNVTFINSARGGVHDTETLKRAVSTGKLSGLILDVWENEPDIDLELLKLTDLATPHIAGYSYDGKIRGMMMIYEAMCKHFGLNPSRTMDEFLPDPEIKMIQVEDLSDQHQLYKTVTAIYNISNDDRRMREIIKMSNPEKSSYFDQLRKTYPIRREFLNTKVNCENSETLKKLKGIGFDG